MNDGRIVIVGGGIIGLSIAFHLGRLGHRDVVVLERGLIGEGATAYATGGIRSQFSTRVNIELAQRSIDFWLNFEALTGAPLDFRQHGYLFLLSQAEQAMAFEQSVRLQRALGVPVEWLTADRIIDVFPGVRITDLLAGVYSPGDGSASPSDAVAGYARAARSDGIDIRQRTEFVGLSRGKSGAVTGVVTTAGDLEAPTVVLAAGPWTNAVGLLCGLDLPVAPHPRQAFATAPLAGISGALPLTVDLASGAYVHPEVSGTAVIGGNDRDVASSDVAAVNWSRAESLAASLSHRFPFMHRMQVVRGWSGLREMTPDDQAVVGPIDDVEGLWVVAGFSGHGFMQSPAVGNEVAQLLTKGEPNLDLSPLNPARFGPVKLATEPETAVF